MYDVKEVREYLEHQTGLDLWVDDLSYSYKLVIYTNENVKVAEFIHNGRKRYFGEFQKYDI